MQGKVEICGVNTAQLKTLSPVQMDELLTKACQGDESARLHQKLLQESDRYIREHYAEDISLAALAERCGLHPNYFHKLYTSAFGKTPAQKLLDCRIAAAKMALIAGNRSMAEIAAECGFSSQTYFGYKFKQATGRTPLQYRKRVLGTQKA